MNYDQQINDLELELQDLFSGLEGNARLEAQAQYLNGLRLIIRTVKKVAVEHGYVYGKEKDNA